MENMHPVLVIELASRAHQERIAQGLANWSANSHLAPRATPRVAVARALVALAGRLAPSVSAANADALA